MRDERMQQRTDAGPPEQALLPPKWAFVVQLREGTPVSSADLTGRIEHIVSGERAHFVSIDAVLAFMRRMLAFKAIGSDSVREPASVEQRESVSTRAPARSL